MRPFPEDVPLTKASTFNGTCFSSESNLPLNVGGLPGDTTPPLTFSSSDHAYAGLPKAHIHSHFRSMSADPIHWLESLASSAQPQSKLSSRATVMTPMVIQLNHAGYGGLAVDNAATRLVHNRRVCEPHVIRSRSPKLGPTITPCSAEFNPCAIE